MINNYIGQVINQIRKSKDIKYTYFCDQVGVSQPTLSKIENGQQAASAEFIEKTCELFEISLSDFFNLVEKTKGIQKIRLDFDTETVVKLAQLDSELHKKIDSLSIEKKKALYIMLQSHE